MKDKKWEDILIKAGIAALIAISGVIITELSTSEKEENKIADIKKVRKNG